jgi:hypothetical protein
MGRDIAGIQGRGVFRRLRAKRETEREYEAAHKKDVHSDLSWSFVTQSTVIQNTLQLIGFDISEIGRQRFLYRRDRR